MKPDESLEVPRDVALQIPKDQTVQVVVLFPESSEDAEWRRLTSEQFLRGYSEGDSIYDAL
jgi:hypothetical protein